MSSDELFAAAFLTIKNKNMQLVPFDYNMVQRYFCAYSTGRDLILKARQHGFSTMLQSRLFRVNITEPSSALTISDIDDNTKVLRLIYQGFYDKWPDDIPKPYRALDSASMVTYPELDSMAMCVTAGSKTGGRSRTVSHFHGSEVAFWRDADSVFAAALQACTPGAEIFLESTPNGAQGRFYELCMEALDGGTDWRLHFYPWWWATEYQIPLEPGEIITPTEEEEEAILKAHQGGFDLKPEQIKWRRKKRRELPHTFLQEYPEDPKSCFLLSGSSYFGDVSNNFNAPFGAEPSEDATYDAALDFGQSNDYTVMPIGNRATRQQVDILRIRQLPWPEIREQIMSKVRKWKPRRLVAEINSIGSVNYDYLAGDIAKLNETLPDDKKINLIPFATTGVSKPPLIQNLYFALHDYNLQLLDTVDETGQHWHKREYGAFRAKQSPHTRHWKYEAAEGEHDDSVIADALMWAAMTRPDIAEITVLDG